MLEDYLVRALKDDIGILKFMNVIRVITGKSIIHNGVDGDEHFKAVKRLAEIKNSELELENDVDDEEVEINDIISSYLQKE